ncbi:hypothetical protein G5714_001203 [Onychostoma macrolepis]|uniref:Uncharacterized protein n=1 Tax=Onychostoma macrolepis TaxID=369639 RepID=A0A7J6DIJ9_9TELE|nr:hypothetical protein G5714_001203 [Onychostoma macrolepis]
MVPDDRLQTHSMVSTDMTSHSAGVTGSQKFLQSTLNEDPPLSSTSSMKMPFWTVSHCHLQTMAPPFGPVAFITCQNWLEGRRALGPYYPSAVCQSKALRSTCSSISRGASLRNEGKI